MALRVLLSVEKNAPVLQFDLIGCEGGAGREAGRVAPAVGQLALLQLSDQLLGIRVVHSKSEE